MTIASTPRRSGPFATDGAQTEFAFDFKVFNEEDVTVTSSEDGVDAELEHETDYTVALNEDQDASPGGTVTLLVAPDGPTITLTSDMAIEQPVVVTNQGGFYPRVFNDAFDRLTIYVQQLKEKVDRAALRTLGAAVAGLYVVTDAEGNFTYSAGTGADAALRTDLAAPGGSALVAGLNKLPLSVLDHAPSAAIAAAVSANTHTADSAAWIGTAAAAAVAAGRPLWFPAGTYPMEQWLPPASLEVWTNGRSTIFKQLDTVGFAKPFILIKEDGVRLWPGSIATIDGSMDNTPVDYGAPGDGFVSPVPGRNATSFNHAIMVYPQNGDTVNTFVCGDIYGLNNGGDVFCTAAQGTGVLGRCDVGTVYGENTYRNIVSIVSGTSGYIKAVKQIGGVGLLTFDIEPDPSSTSPPKNWHVEHIEGTRATAAGDANVPVESFTFGTMDLDYARGSSTPAFSYDTTEGTNPDTFRIGFRHRNIKNIVGRVMKIANHVNGAIKDIGEAVGDSIGELFKVDYVEIANCGATSTYEIAQQKTQLLDIGYINSVDKAAWSVATIICGTAGMTTRIGGGKIKGLFTVVHAGNITISDTQIDAESNSAFYAVSGDIRLTGVTVTDAVYVFNNCSKVPVCIDCDLTTQTSVSNVVNGGAAQARYFGCRIHGVEVELGWHNASTALKDAANDAAAATAGTPVNAAYRNGSALMVRVT